MPVRLFTNQARETHRARMRGLSASEVLLQGNRFSTNRELELAGYTQVNIPVDVNPQVWNWLLENVGDDNVMLLGDYLWFTEPEQATLFLLRW
jgi:hypothetical protein